jgi:WD40 repeat protein
MGVGDQQSGIGIREMAMAADGSCVAILSDRQLMVRNVESGAELTMAADLPDHAHGLRLSRDGRRVSVQDHRGYLRIWDTSTSELVSTLYTHGKDGWSGAQVLADGRTILRLKRSDREIELVDVETGLVTLQLTAPWPLWLIRVSTDGRWVVASSSRDHDGWRESEPDGDRVWDTTTGMAVRFPGGRIRGRWAVYDTTLGSRVHDLATGEIVFDRPDCRRLLTASAAWVERPAIVTGFADGSLDIWDLAGGSRLHHVAEHAAAIVAIAVAPGGGIAAASADGAVLLGTAKSKVEVAYRGGLAMRDCIFRPDGSVVTLDQAGRVHRIQHDFGHW